MRAVTPLLVFTGSLAEKPRRVVGVCEDAVGGGDVCLGTTDEADGGVEVGWGV